MAKYAIQYKEILARTYIVEAPSYEEAVEKVHDAAYEGGLQLDYNDYWDCEIVNSLYANPDGTATEFQLRNCEELTWTKEEEEHE